MAGYEAAKATTLNAHYTSPTVIKAIYQAVENMGFRTGNVLEPSCGIGNFFGLVPESMKDSKLFGVELDSITGRVAQQLYQQNSIAVQGFEDNVGEELRRFGTISKLYPSTHRTSGFCVAGFLLCVFLFYQAGFWNWNS